jgi:YVTN family beta-propeller protein
LATLSVATASAQPYAYVSNVSANNVSVVDTTSHTKVATISTPLSPSGLAMTSDGSLVYVACLRANSVAVIGTASNAVVATIAVGSGPSRLAITSVVTSKAASCGHLKTGQLNRTPGQVSYTLSTGVSQSFFDDSLLARLSGVDCGLH